MSNNESGFIVYRGSSRIDGRPIVGVVTLESDNPKTGNMAQLWILSDVGETPGAAIRSGADASVCGSCPLRALSATGEPQIRRCYVNPMGPASVWRKLQAGGYRQLTPARAGRMLAGRKVRLGAYGDPTALPLEVVQSLIARAAGWTGYTHQWATCDQRWRWYLMASVEESVQVPADWRAFIVEAQPRPGAVQCPASTEAGKRTTCERCGLCNGLSGNSEKNVSIAPHGVAARRF